MSHRVPVGVPVDPCGLALLDDIFIIWTQVQLLRNLSVLKKLCLDNDKRKVMSSVIDPY